MRGVMKKRIAISIVCVLGIGATVVIWGIRDHLHFYGYLEGQCEARREIAEDRMTVYVYGDVYRGMSSDKDTGLPQKAIAGCIVNKRLIGRAKGHNRLIRKHLGED
jgi:hypothetical protein